MKTKLRLLLMLAASTVTVIGCGGGSEPTTSPGDDQNQTQEAGLPPEAIAQMKVLIEEKAARTPAQRKISSALLYAKSGRFAAKSAYKSGPEVPGAAPQIESLLQTDDEGRVLSDVKGDVDANLERAIETLGGKVVAASMEHDSVRAWLRLDSIEELAAQSIVRAVRPALMATTNRADNPRAVAKLQKASYPERVAKVQEMLAQLAEAKAGRPAAQKAATNVGAAESAGGPAHLVDRARKFYNVDGTGIKIGVLSDSDDFKEASIASGDLRPDTVTVPGESGRPGSGEGTAMMEIIQDLAPGAQLFFATAFTSPESFADNIRRLRFEFDCDVIVDDVIYFFESPYQDDIIAQAVDDVVADGAMYFSSAGNQGNYDDGTSGTWEGDFKPAGTLSSLPAGYTVHDFGGKVISNRIELSGGPLILHWSDPGDLDTPQSGNDYDLFVLDSNLRNVIVAATDVQDGDDLPFEFLGFLIPSDFRVVVARNPGAQTRAIRILHFGGELGIATDGGSYGHAAAHGAFGVAAVDVAEAVGGEFIAGPTTPVELFSTDGNRRVFYDRNGVRIRGGVTFASGGGEFRLKPEVSGADGVDTTLPPSSGLNPFFGTSAAAPHVAAIAGLAKQGAPSAGSYAILQAILNGALDIEANGRDHSSGMGIVSAMNTLRIAGAKPAVFLELGTVTPTPTGSDAIIPGGGATLAIQIANNGGASATNVSAQLTSTTPGVSVTTGASAYPNIAAGGSATNTTPFAFTLAPGAVCGSRLDFSLRVTFSGRGTTPTTLEFDVGTGRVDPATTVASFTGPPVAIPDNNVAGVSIPLPVTGVGPLSRLSFTIDGAACSAAIGSTTVGVNHTWVGDLVFRLTSPAGTGVDLIRQAGGSLNSGNNFCQTVLQDGAANSIQNVLTSQAPFSGTFAPANPQAAFAGENADGTWTLTVSDLAGFDTGSVRAFSARLNGFSCTP